jgi:mannose-1-phosphate guanylyltransferase
MKVRRYAVVMAGGRGTRFWPLSRLHTPKQLLKIRSKKSLIRETVDRVLPLFGPKNTLVVTVADHYESIRKELSMLPKANFLIEPQGNNTAPCIGLAAVELASRYPNAIMTVLPADHWVSDFQSFRRTIQAAAQLVEKHDALVTIGIRPSYPETGYGYILKGARIKGAGGVTAHRVKGFKEKPTLKKAGQLMRKGSLWNSGIFSWRASTILAMLGRFAPSVSRGLDKIEQGARGLKISSRSPRLEALIRREYRKMPNVSIDHAVLEKAGAENRVLTVSARFGWSDVGSWAAVHQMLPQDKNGNAGVGRWLGMQSRNCLVYTQDRLVALLGIQDAVIIDTPDALLVCDIRESQRVKDLVEQLERKGYGQYTVR